jgi:hypothetical protein
MWNQAKAIAREIRPNAIWDSVKIGGSMIFSLLATIAHKTFAIFALLPQGLIADITIFVVTFVAFLTWYAIWKYGEAKKQKEIRSALIDFSKKGDEILNAILSSNIGQETINKVYLWEMHVARFLKENLGESQAQIFKSKAPIQPYPNPIRDFTNPQMDILNDLYTRLVRLQELIRG